MDPEYPDYKVAEFDSMELALEAAKKRILASFERSDSGEESYKNWLMFGEDAYILSPARAKKVNFSGQKFVKEICKIE
jgi:hypothetical protein